MNKHKAIKTIILDATTANGEKRTTKTAKTNIAENKTSTKPSTPNKIKVLSAFNRISIDSIKMGVSHVRTIRLPTTTNRMNSTMTQRMKNPPATLAKRKTIGSGEKTCPVNSSMVLSKKSDKLSCRLCGMTFFFKTSLASHNKTAHATQNICKYCGRNFALSTAISKHLRENCIKIPTADRKKLLEKDEKEVNQKTPTKSPKLNRATNELLDLVFASYSPSSGLDRLKVVPFKDVAPIKGIRNTPRKPIKCFECGDKFKNPLLYATHAEHCVPTKIDFK